ncbi:MAG TPA: hypothetical protein DEQ02_03815 [Ruminococcaceae bacterium]|nr:hypothetical protein [Oscillospiraceae bacterium]
MNRLVIECFNFMKDFRYPYAFCGGHALELFTGTIHRPHSDIDISVFSEDRGKIVEFMLAAGWNVFEHKVEWIDNKNADSYLRSILNANDEKLTMLSSVWVIKPECSFIKIKPKQGEDNCFDYEILNNEQLEFDFIEVVFNLRQDRNFVCDKEKRIMRALDKAMLYNNSVPYLAPEIILLFICNPVYINSEYHRDKNRIDFYSNAPALSRESKDWLINALKTAYPEGNSRLEEIMTFKE